MNDDEFDVSTSVFMFVYLFFIYHDDNTIHGTVHFVAFFFKRSRR